MKKLTCIIFLFLCGLYFPPVQAASFPTIRITTPQNPFVDRETWQNGTISISGDFPLSTVDARIRGRGNSTWAAGADKRPLRFRLSEPMSILGSGYVATDWILLANHFDRSLLRNYTALTLGGMLDGLDFTPRPHFVHLYVNNNYMGVYILTDERDVGQGRMPLKTGDFFIELDARAQDGGVENETFFKVDEMLYDLRWPSNTYENAIQARDYVKNASAAIQSRDFERIQQLIDMDSFIDFYIIQELFKNSDIWSLSVFMSVRNGVLYMGPVWDFDLSAGNTGVAFMNPEGLYVAVSNHWFYYLMTTPEFFDAVTNRWKEIRFNEIEYIVNHINLTVQNYRGEFERNFTRHNIMGANLFGSTAETMAIPDFIGHVNHFTNWLNNRIAWLDEFFNTRETSMWESVIDYFIDNPILIDSTQVNPPAILLGDSQTRISLYTLENVFGINIRFLENGRIIFQQGSKSVIYVDNYLLVNGLRVDITPMFFIEVDDFIYVPLRLILENLGFNVDWHLEINGQTHIKTSS